MNFDPTHVPVAFLNLQPWSIAIVVPLFGLIFAGVIIVTTMYFQHRRTELWHQTARIALEKGQPLPAMPDSFAPNNPGCGSRDQPRWRGYLIGGLINLGVGAGLYLALSQISNTPFNVGYFGFIPLFIGVALLLGAVIEALAARK